ncbi:hypothetical protein VPH35_055863 [Triticum aestivum]|uniref:Uncharacterized protein n=1 Tax=Triticum aestivum TaxID=4565 RepID=A0A077RZB2_WHEAT|nr:unnamed protein product [Triticum aestivum]
MSSLCSGSSPPPSSSLVRATASEGELERRSYGNNTGYYPSAAAEKRQAGGGKKSHRGSTKSRGEKGFIEGWFCVNNREPVLRVGVPHHVFSMSDKLKGCKLRKMKLRDVKNMMCDMRWCCVCAPPPTLRLLGPKGTSSRTEKKIEPVCRDIELKVLLVAYIPIGNPSRQNYALLSHDLNFTKFLVPPTPMY